jgi:hypothetical protein
MPCYRCGVRQTDPDRGQSPWKRGVLRHSQILICPGCQDTADWTAELDRCPRCASVHLIKRLGEVECRDCGAIVPPEDCGETVAGPEGAGRGSDLSEEVARALDRVLGRSLVSQSIQRAPGSTGGAGAPAGARAPETGHQAHPGTHPGAERNRAARPGAGRRSADGLDEVRPGAFAG